MRVGLVCPYSVSVPGGVQAQVLGLARVLRRMGHETRVLAPCDGPPPELFVTPLGNSVPTAANGSVAPLAPDPACALRTIRALRDEQFDVIHVHEPIAPGPTMTAAVHALGADGGHVPRRRRLVVVPVAHAPRALGGEPHRPSLRRVARRPAPRPAVHRRRLRRAVQRRRGRSLGPGRAGRRPTGPPIFFCGRHEPRKGLEVLLEAMGRLPERRAPLGGERRPRHRPAPGPHSPATPASNGWAGVSEAEKMARMRGASAFCAPSLRGESFGVVLLEAMAASTPIVASDLPRLPQRGPTPAPTPCWCRPTTPWPWPTALQRVLTSRDLAERLRGRATSAAGSSRWRRWRRATWRSTEQLRDRRPGGPGGRAERSWRRRPRTLLDRLTSSRRGAPWVSR